ncbi:unnamed protein product, partial [marine sediment metagenome]
RAKTHYARKMNVLVFKKKVKAYVSVSGTKIPKLHSV